MPLFGFIFTVSFLAVLNGHAGDAVVIGYNSDGDWTAVTYFRFATPKSGRDYRTSAEAAEAAVRDYDVTDVGRGKTQAEADGKALALLTSNGATKDQKAVYRYFSYGADSK